MPAIKTAVGAATAATAWSVFLISRHTMPRDRPDGPLSSRLMMAYYGSLFQPRGLPHSHLKVQADEYPIRWTLAYMP